MASEVAAIAVTPWELHSGAGQSYKPPRGSAVHPGGYFGNTL